MNSIRERILNRLKERQKKVLQGEVNCIPLPFSRFKNEFPGIEQGKYYLITAATKGKLIFNLNIL